MKPLNLDSLRRRAAGRSLLVFLDFDGTISEHRPEGERSKITPSMRTALAALVRRADTRVSIVTGRPIKDVSPRVGVKHLVYAGNHGLEIRGAGELFLHPLSPAIMGAARAAAVLARQRFRDEPKVVIDHNGLSLSVNIGLVEARRRPAMARVIESLRRELAWLRLRVEQGHLGWDLIPEVDWNKGSAVRRLRKRWPEGLPIAVGDGLSDEAMFEAVGAEGFSVKVGRGPSSKAKYWLRSPREVERLLRALASS